VLHAPSLSAVTDSSSAPRASSRRARQRPLIEACLTLLTNPQELYRRCDDEKRRLLNQAIFLKLYVDHDKITGHELHEPFARLHAVKEAHLATDGEKPDPGARSVTPHKAEGPSPVQETVLLPCLTAY